MATVLDHAEPTAERVAGTGARAILASLGRLGLVPAGPALYAVTGALELPQVAGQLDRVSGARVLVANAAEAAALTGLAEPEAAALWLAGLGTTAIVTLGAAGAVAAEGDTVHREAAPSVPVVDPTGAGDLFVAAYAWADLSGAPLRDRLAGAGLYAALSVRAPTAFAGAVSLEELLREGEERGLARPPRAGRG